MGVLLTIAFCGALVVGSGVVAWFHGEKGTQVAPVIEYVLLSVLGVIWLAVSAWIVIAN